ncbi:hypothetical protein AB6C81_05590 [Vibrio splendidus]|jgi:hypothetical protein
MEVDKTSLEYIGLLIAAIAMIFTIASFFKKVNSSSRNVDNGSIYIDGENKIEGGVGNTNSHVTNNFSSSQSPLTPKELASPNLHASIVSKSFVSGQDLKFSIKLENKGGDFLRVNVNPIGDRSGSNHEFAKISSGGAQNVAIKLSPDTMDICLIITGYDCNGEKYHMTFTGNRTSEILNCNENA